MHMRRISRNLLIVPLEIGINPRRWYQTWAPQRPSAAGATPLSARSQPFRDRPRFSITSPAGMLPPACRPNYPTTRASTSRWSARPGSNRRPSAWEAWRVVGTAQHLPCPFPKAKRLQGESGRCRPGTNRHEPTRHFLATIRNRPSLPLQARFGGSPHHEWQEAA